MSVRSRVILLGASACVALGGVWAYRAMYAERRDALLADLEAVRGENEQYEAGLMAGAQVRRELEALSAGAVRGEADFADHALRTALRELAASAGLGAVEISADAPRGQENPYVRTRRVNRTLQRMIAGRGAADFGTIDSTVQGEGDLEGVLRFVALAESQPWLHRVRGLSISPVGPARERFTVRLDASTLYLPERGESAVPSVSALSAESMARYQPIAMKNVFKRPARPEPAAERPRERPAAAPPPPPFEQWRLTGVWESAGGVRVIVTNTSSGESETLVAGDGVLGASLVEATQKRAVFELDGKRYEVLNGETLAQRRALDD